MAHGAQIGIGARPARRRQHIEKRQPGLERIAARRLHRAEDVDRPLRRLQDVARLVVGRVLRQFGHHDDAARGDHGQIGRPAARAEGVEVEDLPLEPAIGARHRNLDRARIARGGRPAALREKVQKRHLVRPFVPARARDGAHQVDRARGRDRQPGIRVLLRGFGQEDRIARSDHRKLGPRPFGKGRQVEAVDAAIAPQDADVARVGVSGRAARIRKDVEHARPRPQFVGAGLLHFAHQVDRAAGPRDAFRLARHEEDRAGPDIGHAGGITAVEIFLHVEGQWIAVRDDADLFDARIARDAARPQDRVHRRHPLFPAVGAGAHDLAEDADRAGRVAAVARAFEGGTVDRDRDVAQKRRGRHEDRVERPQLRKQRLVPGLEVALVVEFGHLAVATQLIAVKLRAQPRPARRRHGDLHGFALRDVDKARRFHVAQHADQQPPFHQPQIQLRCREEHLVQRRAQFLARFGDRQPGQVHFPDLGQKDAALGVDGDRRFELRLARQRDDDAVAGGQPRRGFGRNRQRRDDKQPERRQQA